MKNPKFSAVPWRIVHQGFIRTTNEPIQKFQTTIITSRNANYSLIYKWHQEHVYKTRGQEVVRYMSNSMHEILMRKLSVKEDGQIFTNVQIKLSKKKEGKPNKPPLSLFI